MLGLGHSTIQQSNSRAARVKTWMQNLPGQEVHFILCIATHSEDNGTLAERYAKDNKTLLGVLGCKVR